MRAVVIVYSLMIVGAAGLGRLLGTPSLFTAPAGVEGVVASLVAAIVTERGVHRAPFAETLPRETAAAR